MISLRVRCSGRLHRILYNRGRLSLPDHCVDAELAALKLGGEPCRCMQILLSFRGELHFRDESDWPYDPDLYEWQGPRQLTKMYKQANLKRGWRQHHNFWNAPESLGPELARAVLYKVMKVIARFYENTRERVLVRLHRGGVLFMVHRGECLIGAQVLEAVPSTKLVLSWSQCKAILQGRIQDVIYTVKGRVMPSERGVLLVGPDGAAVQQEKPKCW